MKKLAMLLLLAVAVTIVAVVPASAGVGNGAPSGQHFTLNIIGVSNPKTTDMTDSQRHTIFVPLTGTCGIGLTETPDWGGTYTTSDFQVLDGNCFDPGQMVAADGTVINFKYFAGFQLPPPDPTGTGTLQYSVYAKVTSPKGSANMQTCFYDQTTAETYCNTGMMLDLSKANYPKFQNVSKALLTVCAPIVDSTGVITGYETQPLFAQAGAPYWWEYDNKGLQHAQFRFYPNTKDNSSYVNTACTAGKPLAK